MGNVFEARVDGVNNLVFFKFGLFRKGRGLLRISEENFMYILSDGVVFRDFGGNKNIIPIKGQLAKEGVIIELNEEAFQILECIRGSYKNTGQILSCLKVMFDITDADISKIEELLENLVSKKIVLKLND